MRLPPRIPKKEKRSERWRSQRHRNFVRSHACTNCGSMAGIEVAHVRIGSGAGMSQKPDDWRTVSLCGGPDGCHPLQHTMGEKSFWDDYAKRNGCTVEELIDAFCKHSPVAREIREARGD